MVVDDDLGIRRLARLTLALAGFDVVLASDGREALTLLSKDTTDVVVLDLNMPVMDGYTFVHNLDDVRYRPSILILSGEHAERARRELGADASLQKPFLPEELIAKVTELSSPTRTEG
jgi:two-component system chemotaxis response regulator CheY